MKYFLNYLGFSVLLSTVFFFSCNEEEISNKQDSGEVEFSFSMLSEIDARKTNTKEDESSIFSAIVTIENSSGEVVYEMEEVNFYAFNNDHISEPLALLVGDYKLTKFLLLNESDSVIYASPTSDSPKSYLVNNSLPIDISINKDEVTKIVPEVLSTENNLPGDFGYSSFGYQIRNTFDFLVTAFIYDEDILNFELTTANLLVVSENDTLYDEGIEDITNEITIRDEHENYTVEISKPGYKTFAQTYSSDSLKQHYNDPLTIILQKGFWESGTPMPTVRAAFEAVTYNGKIYVMGGSDYTDDNSSVEQFGVNEIYDPIKDEWTTGAPMPTPRHGHHLVVYNDSIYAIGGYNSSSGDLSVNEVYDPVSDTWTSKSNALSSRRSGTIEVVGDKIYLIGGISGNSGVSTTEIYDAAKDTWTTGISMPTARGYIESSIYDGKIYIFGGAQQSTDTESTLSVTEIFDPFSNSWSTGKDMPTSRRYLGVASLGNEIYCLGGNNENHVKANEVYDPVTNSWKSSVDMPTAKAGFAICVYNNKIYTFGGGIGGKNRLDIVEVFTP